MASVRSAHLLIFTQQFAAMIRSSLPLVDVLDNLARETPQRNLRNAIEDVSDRVKHGIDLGDALANHPDIFNNIYVNVIRAGLASGRLGDAITQITIYLEVMHQVRRRVRSALSYPMFMVIAFILVFNGMVFFILPRFSRMFSNFGKELPWGTQVLMNMGAFWTQNWYYVVGGALAVVLAFIIWISTADGRAVWDRMKLHLPIMGSIWRMGALARFIRTLAVQIRNEIMLLEALILSAQATQNIYVEESLYEIANAIERGSGLAEAFRKHTIFDGIILQMIAAGEEAGTLDELLLSAADYFESLLNDRLESVTGMINPVLTIFIGLAVAGMMVAAFLPVFQIGALAGG